MTPSYPTDPPNPPDHSEFSSADLTQFPVQSKRTLRRAIRLDVADIQANIQYLNNYLTATRQRINPEYFGLVVEKPATLLILHIDPRAILGRYSAATTDECVDLVPFGAFEKGVSRLHAAIYRYDVVEGLHQHAVYAIQDLHSSNGTWINGQRLGSALCLLHHGDWLRLGQLSCLVALSY